ncbi:unnamed protein product [Ixodes pacificus]
MWIPLTSTLLSARGPGAASDPWLSRHKSRRAPDHLAQDGTISTRSP